MDSNAEEVEGNQQDEWNQDTIDQFESDLNTIEATLTRHLEELKITGSTDLQEETSLKELPTANHPLLHTTQRIISTLKSCKRAEEFIKKEYNNLKKKLKDQQFVLEQVELERDVLLQQVHAYLETNSSLRVRLEEQRCQSGSLQKQANANLELKIKSLENDKEQLNDSNMEKDKQIHKMAVMLEQTTKCLRNRETEVLNRKNEESNLVTMLKADLKKALEEKADLEERYSILKERLEDYSCSRNAGAVNSRLKRSLSVGDVNPVKVIHRENHILLEPPNEVRRGGSHSRQVLKTSHEAESNQVETTHQTPWRIHASRSWPLPQTTTDRSKSTPVHTQLNALRRDLVNVTRKLDALKSQLIISGVIAEEETRRLKRKAQPVEETEDEGISEGHKSEFKNLRSILQDAKNLNAKLQNLRDEKQRIIEKNQEKEAAETSEQFCPREFQNALLELKKAVKECEQQFDGGAITEEEAFVDLVSPVFSCIISNLGCCSEWRRRTGGMFSDDGESLADETSAGEDGGGDNPLKMLSSTEHCKESKSEGARVNLKMDHSQKV